MPGAGEAPPILDFSRFYKGDSATKKELVEEVRNCCLHNGFFQITGHNVPLELQNKMMDWSKLTDLDSHMRVVLSLIR